MVTRFVTPPKLERKRLQAFVGLDNLTAQMPLIEVVRKRPFHIRIWVAYDYERRHGTYTAVYYSGMVETITINPDGSQRAKINRPV
jgi:hypothetical protein